MPSASSRLPTPAARSSSTVPVSSIPARCLASQYARDRFSTSTESMPASVSRCDRSSPAGQAPTMPTWVREVTAM